MTVATDGLVILLHGVGSNGASMQVLANHWRAELPRLEFVAPDAPQASEFGWGFQWFSVAGVTRDNRPGRIAAARAGFDHVIGQCLRQHGFENRLDRVVFAGFSQGAMMLLDAVASGRWPVAGGLAYSGRLASPGPLLASPTKLLLVHGDADNVVPVQDGIEASSILQRTGFDVESRVYPGLGHEISPDGVALGLKFIKGLLA